MSEQPDPQAQLEALKRAIHEAYRWMRETQAEYEPENNHPESMSDKLRNYSLGRSVGHRSSANVLEQAIIGVLGEMP